MAGGAKETTIIQTGSAGPAWLIIGMLLAGAVVLGYFVIKHDLLGGGKEVNVQIELPKVE